MTDQTKSLLPVTPELLPCPFCGGPAELDDLGDPQDDSMVSCCNQLRCGIQQIARFSPETAITAWNTRSQSHSLPGDAPRRIEVERDPDGKVMICTGCGTVETLASIKARCETAFSCCPERNMVRALPLESLRRNYGDVSIDHALRSALRFAASRSVITAKDEQAILVAFAALTPSALSGDAGEESAQRLQDHMEQHHGICLSASDWDAAIRAAHQGAGEP